MFYDFKFGTTIIKLKFGKKNNFLNKLWTFIEFKKACRYNLWRTLTMAIVLDYKKKATAVF